MSETKRAEDLERRVRRLEKAVFPPDGEPVCLLACYWDENDSEWFYVHAAGCPRFDIPDSIPKPKEPAS